MESQPQNPEFRIDPENFHQCIVSKTVIEKNLTLFLVSINSQCRARLNLIVTYLNLHF